MHSVLINHNVDMRGILAKEPRVQVSACALNLYCLKLLPFVRVCKSMLSILCLGDIERQGCMQILKSAAKQDLDSRT